MGTMIKPNPVYYRLETRISENTKWAIRRHSVDLASLTASAEIMAKQQLLQCRILRIVEEVEEIFTT